MKHNETTEQNNNKEIVQIMNASIQSWISSNKPILQMVITERGITQRGIKQKVITQTAITQKGIMQKGIR